MRDRNGRTLEYLNKSEAEYGINSQIQENASNTMYFEHGENPAESLRIEQRNNPSTASSAIF